jgi:hypothetical protein
MTTTTTSTNTTDLTKITSNKGCFVSVSFKSEKKPSAQFKGVELVKVTNGVFRSGIDFANLSSVKQGIASGERGEVQSLPWGEWVSFPYIISHKNQEYVRLYPVANPNSKLEVTYFVNGTQVSKDEFNGYLTPSDAKSSAVECFTVKASNILSIG